MAVEHARLLPDAMAVVLTLSRAPGPREPLTVSYRLEGPDSRLWDAEGSQVAPFTGQAVSPPRPPDATWVAVVSDAGSDAIYALTATPELGAALSDTGREYRLG